MSTPAEDLKEAHEHAVTLLSEQYRKYLRLAGRLLPVLLARFRDDVAEALGENPLALPQRSGQVKATRLDEMTSAELDAATRATKALVMRFVVLMEDPQLPDLLADFLGMLKANADERVTIAAEFGPKAKAS